ncbi:Zinc finger, PHD-finger [Phytophthora cactorum]|nr:Zinc finger, PHD-finger [Phytophthora cactorum]
MADTDDLMQELCGVSVSDIDVTQDAAQELLEQRLLAIERARDKAQQASKDDDEMAPAQKHLQAVAQLRSEEQDNEDEDTHICGSIAVTSAESRLVTAYEIFLIGVAYFDMYVQANYTGPAFEKETLRDVLDLAARSWRTPPKATTRSRTAMRLWHYKWMARVRSPSANTAVLLVGRCLLDFVGNHAYNDWSVAANEVVSGQNDNEVSDDVVEGPAKRQITGGAAIRALGEMLEKIKSAAWWNARAAVAHERLLLAKQPSNTLWFEARRGYIQTLKTAELFAFEKDTQYLLACAYVEWNKHGKATFARAKGDFWCECAAQRSMGKRTKFQQKSVAQMVLSPRRRKSLRQVTVEEGEGGNNAAPPADGLTAEEEHIQRLVHEGEASYRNVNLDQVDQDNYLLESIAFEDRKLTQQGNLQIVDQLVLLGLCLDVKNSNANDGLTREEMMPYVTRVLENPNNWMVYSTALLERAWLECESSKRRERAVLQMQALVDQHTTRLTITQNTLQSIADSAPARERMQFRDLAERYFKLGVLGSAVEICEELEMWDDVVKCYQLLDKPMRAEKLVRERLEIAPTPFMWVTLGDLAKNLHTTRRPGHSRSSGLLTGDHEAAIPHYEDAVRVGPMHTGAWFTLGAIAMRVQRWALAMRAFTRVVQLEPDNVLEEALKQKRHMWQMWENYALCAMETKRYGEAMYAMHQLLDMRAKHKRPVDSEMLAWLVEAIVYPESLKKMQQDAADEDSQKVVSDDEEDNVDQVSDDEDLAGLDEAATATDATPPRSDSHYKKQLAMLFGRVTSIVYAHFNDGVEGRADKARDCRLKQCRALQVAGWEREQQKVEDLCAAASRLAEDYLAEGTKKALYSCRLYIRGVLKKAHVDFAELEAVKTLAAALDEVNSGKRNSRHQVGRRGPVKKRKLEAVSPNGELKKAKRGPAEPQVLVDPETTIFLQLLEDDARRLPPPPPPLLKRRGSAKSPPEKRIVEFQLPFKEAEIKSLRSANGRCVYVSTKMPIADFPVHKCTCYEETHKSMTKRTTIMASAKAQKELEDKEQHVNFYMMELEKNIVIDAKYRSNDSRFINHSCDPNSVTQKWNVDGMQRIGIFARRNISPNEEITIDYNFSHFGEAADCRCGSTACTGKIGLKRSKMPLFNPRVVGSAKARKQVPVDEEPPELKRPVHLTSLALLKSSQMFDSWLEYYGYKNRRLFLSHRSRRPKKENDGVKGVHSGEMRRTPPSGSPASVCSTTTEEDVSLTPPQAGQSKPVEKISRKSNWYEKSSSQLHLRWYIRLDGTPRYRFHDRGHFIFTGKKNGPGRPPKKRAFAKGKSKWNKRVPSSSSIDPDRIHRLIDRVKGKQIFINTDQNDLNEDACFRCGLAGELICCDGCPAAFHLNCTNLAMVPPDGIPWFCSECTNPKHPQKTSETSHAAVIAAGVQEAAAIPSLKKIFHAPAPHTKRRYKKRHKATARSYRELEHMPLPVWNESDASETEQ